MSTPRPRRRRGVALVVLPLLAIAMIAAPVAGAFGPTRIIRTADQVLVSGIAAKGSGVAVIWEEEPSGGTAIFYRTSENGGDSFVAARRLDTRPNRNGSVAVCQGWAWIASEIHLDDSPAGEWDLVVDGRDLDGTGDSGLLVTDPDLALNVRAPAIACVGDRFLAVTWLEKVGAGSWRAKLLVFDPTPPFPGGAPAGAYDASVDLGTANRNVRPAIDASNRRVGVVWGKGSDLRFRRIAVAPGPTVSLDPSSAQTLASGPDGSTAVAVDGSRVVAAYARNNDLFTRRSTNGGASFSAAVKRLDGDDFGFIAYVSSIDLVGSRVLLLANIAYGDLDPYTEEWRLRSADGGATFSRRKVGTKGERVGAWSGPANAPRAVEAWDDWTDHVGDNHIRYHRED